MNINESLGAGLAPNGKRAEPSSDMSVRARNEQGQPQSEAMHFQRKASSAELEELVGQMQDSVKVMQRNLNFSIHDTTGTTVVKVMDASTGELIRQMPTEDALRLAERLDEMRSLLFDARA